MTSILHFKNPRLDTSKPHRTIQERVVFLCTVCHEPSKGLCETILNEGDYLSATSTFLGNCGNKECKAVIEEMFSVYMEYR
jgi:hypothetical protein